MTVNLENVRWLKKTRGSAAIAPTINIAKSGQLQISEAAIGLIGDAPEAFVIGVLQGRANKVSLVLQAAAKGDSDAYVVSKPATSKTYNLNTKKVLTENDLDSHFGTKGIEVTFDTDSKVLVAPLG